MLKTAPEVKAAFADIDDRQRRHLSSRSTTKRDRTSIEFERALAPQLRGDPRRARQLPVAERRRRPRHHDHARRRRSRRARTRPRSKLVEQHARHPRAARAARSTATSSGPRSSIKPALRPRRRPRRDDRRAQPDDPHRDARRHRPERRQILAVRPPDPDPRRARRECRGATSSTIENLPVPTASGGSVPLKVVADIGFGAGPSQLRRYNQTRRIVDRRRSRARRRSAATRMPKIDALPALQEPAGRASQQGRSSATASGRPS